MNRYDWLKVLGEIAAKDPNLTGDPTQTQRIDFAEIAIKLSQFDDAILRRVTALEARIALLEAEKAEDQNQSI